MGRMQLVRAGTATLLTSLLVAGCAVEDSSGKVEPDPNATLQERVDAVLHAIPGGHQVSATEIDYDGMTAIVDPSYNAQGPVAPAPPACSDGWFCINVSGTAFAFFKCQLWDLSNWFGNAPFNNNQTPGTVARFYDQNFNVIWTNTAKATGTVNVTPFWHFRPC